MPETSNGGILRYSQLPPRRHDCTLCGRPTSSILVTEDDRRLPMCQECSFRLLDLKVRL